MMRPQERGMPVRRRPIGPAYRRCRDRPARDAEPRLPLSAQIDSQPVETNLDYFGVTAIVMLVGFQVLTLPRGDAQGLPFGTQSIARPGEERRLIHMGWVLEGEAGFPHR